MIVKTEDKTFVRDSNTNVLINTDVDAYKQYKQTRMIDKQFKMMQKKIDTLESLIHSLNERIVKLEQHG
jgi:enoyl-[acyl-carrier-protein] reductase (NADH)